MTGMVIGEAVSRCLYWPVTRPARIHTGADADSDEPCAPTGSDNPLPQEQEQEPEVELGPEPKVDAGAEDDCPATAFAVMAAPPVMGAPVLADPVPRVGERVLARSGLITGAAPVLGLSRQQPVRTDRRSIGSKKAGSRQIITTGH